MRKFNKGFDEGVAGCMFMLLIIFSAWVTHIVTCLSDDRWGFLIAGAIMFPIAVVHGVGIWFGLF